MEMTINREKRTEENGGVAMADAAMPDLTANRGVGSFQDQPNRRIQQRSRSLSSFKPLPEVIQVYSDNCANCNTCVFPTSSCV
jgi:hypothetical protein